jgi:hypothetical protein
MGFCLLGYTFNYFSNTSKQMKPLHHHVQRLAQRFLNAELVKDPEEAQRVVRKAEKHQRKINRWHQLLSPLQNAWRSKS